MTPTKLEEHLPNYIRIQRRRSGLSQRELSALLGFRIESLARHELFHTLPALDMAIRYEVVFRVPVSELFAGLREEIATDIEAKLALFEAELGKRSAKGRNANEIARKLLWLSERKNSNCQSVP